MPPPASGKTRDREHTRARILEAAKVAFSQRGYAAANVREIAASAEINAALVVRYFGSKEQLFVAAVADAFELPQALAGVSRAALGEAMAEMLFGEPAASDLMAMMLRATFEPTLSIQTRALARSRMLEPLAKLIGGSQSERRAAAVLALVTGVWIYRFGLPIDPYTDANDSEYKNFIATKIQYIIDENQL
ncbi:TetR/AcrR family transcriptional regulator [Methylorubrum extorquens]|uniref:Transcriptional regulator, TetR family n=2 Tax=Methylorubrum extorquens TaxID=408 RepID=C5B685_METEA|nr:TetR/AcrR family transcriptional regulator [Methylorubrum extorquens]ACS43967.1 putative transcriptional regulator, TetR family [Methylorubrum extorquens AM1]EHP95088.1 regulatory protein TetR [Methylorubrum extorquens DSM 13060]MCP1546170.1 AcrR family transcriptional regulator [Methylorubrum extorquens]MCP1590837.1 AcrR family transcriptional regulator [Methylorubrum extorquens]